jgi:hypothetical protein
MLGNAKALKRNNRECKGILIGPSMASRFLRVEIPPSYFLGAVGEASASVQISRHGWQADDRTFSREIKCQTDAACCSLTWA